MSKLYEMPKWSMFVLENYGNGKSTLFECKRTTIDLDELPDDEEIFGKCNKKENKRFGGGQWYELVSNYCIVSVEYGSLTNYGYTYDSDSERDADFEDCDDPEETILYFRFKQKDDWDITPDFQKYLEIAHE